MPQLLPTNDCATICAAVVPADDADLPRGVARFLLIGTGGTLKITLANGDTVETTVPAGEFRCAVARVWAAGTSATGITAMY